MKYFILMFKQVNNLQMELVNSETSNGIPGHVF